MNDSPITDEQLDRLVDGESTDAEYGRLLASFDDEPGGWRRCALAFLEAQALGRDLSGIAQPPPAGVPAAPPVSNRQDLTARQSSTKLWPLMLAMSACFLIAFSIGALIPGRWLGAPGQPDESAGVAKSPTTNTTSPTTSAERDDDTTNHQIADGASPRVRRPPPVMAANQTPSSNNTMIIELDDGEQLRRTEIPYYPWDEYSAPSLQDDTPFPPPDFVETVRRFGHDVRQRRQFLPVQLENGRRVLVPVDELEVVPVSGPGYQ